MAHRSGHATRRSAHVVLAAGGVLWREPAGPGGPVEVALVHRPRYDDWTLPKGKAKAGEHRILAALREVEEETGCRPSLGRYLTHQTYETPRARARGGLKRVDYWAMRAVRAGGLGAGSEVDAVAWLPVPEASERLSYPMDRGVLDEFVRVPAADTTPLLFVRAGHRAHPRDPKGLDSRGRAQARTVAAVLAALQVTDLMCAPSPSAWQTLLPHAERMAADGLPLRWELLPDLGVGVSPSPVPLLERIRGVLRAGRPLAVCGHGKALSTLVAALVADTDAVTVAGGQDDDGVLHKGGWLLAHVPRGEVAPGATVLERYPPAG